MTPDSVNCQQQLHQLIGVLEEEHALLQSPDPEALVTVLRSKDALCLELSQLQSALISQLEQSQVDTTLVTLLRECQQKNQRNGQLIDQRRQDVQQRLAQVDTGSSYSPRGEVNAGHRAVSGWEA